MESSPPANSSHGWRSIIAGRDVLRKGLGWIIGDGSLVHVWSSPWLSTSRPSLPTGPPPENDLQLRVCDLIHSNSNTWDVEAIRRHIPVHEEEIRKIILSSSPSRDALRWLPVKSGTYSTKSGYALAKLNSDPSFVDGFNWQTNLWRIKTSPKLKFFLWKAAVGALSVGSALISRGFDSDGRCVRCGGTEDVIHVLLNCPFAQRVWELAPVLFKPNPAICLNWKLFLTSARRMITLPPTGIILTPLFPWIVWFLWKARNLLIFENKIISPEDSLHKAISEAKAWQGAHEVPPPSNPQPESLLTPVLIGSSDSISCFSDAAWAADSNRCGVGWIFKDSTSSIISQNSAYQDHIPSALAAVALAVKLALISAKAADFSRLTCFSDCQELMLLLNSDGLSNEVHGLLLDIRSLRDSFISVVFCFIPRASNSEADFLAKSSLISCNLSSLDRG